ncbi:MAG: hypothetical protein IJJ28_01700, partial [Lentisphaeria bacterium]|nr:hypothetical protein [Lentisphaeria bacterium]
MKNLRWIVMVFLSAVTGFASMRPAAAAEFPGSIAKPLGDGEFRLEKYGSRALSRMFPVDPAQGWLLEAPGHSAAPPARR